MGAFCTESVRERSSQTLWIRHSFLTRSPRGQARAASLRADVRLLDDSPPLIHLGAQKGVKLIRRRADHNDGVPFELVSDRRLCKGCDRIVVNLSNDVPRRLGRNEK